ncbi:RsmB/NOP family class I SAM-dependent RNA methyltransferase [Weissella halotolerans]|uniref:tRNA rRNA methyltransferase n=1 Tax=Weissella halotolerans DSM 20190 TaxID=1123500 RepID=A0A0R2FYP4_9LACO|nr:RsmB/NOP family class I SAM-dependent RNA methyltransferase [Weissella halotolerans]KRN33304.1 tRNA rRNA methyltransferase [Weissella halotolerans DSM 20190]
MTALPTAFIEKYQTLLGPEAQSFLAALQAEPSKAYRINPLKEQSVADTDTAVPVPWSRFGYYGQIDGHSPAHTTGQVYSQEPSAQLVAELAAPKPGSRVLDLAAAPGGKTTHLASFMQGQGLLVANEINYKRAKILSENVERFGIRNALVTNHDAQTLSQHFPGYFDTIVLDAPCSGEGMFRKDPAAIQYWHPDYPAENARRQKEILTDALKMLKPGGDLIYSTCTFAPEEDEQVIAWALKTYPDLSIVPVARPEGVDAGRPEWADGNPALADTLRLFPHHLAGEGHFMAKLHRSATAEIDQSQGNVERTNLTVEQRQSWNALAKELLREPLDGVLYAFGDQLYRLPEGTPSLKQLHVLRPGLHLGTFKKKRFEPSLALALALPVAAFRHQYALTDQQWRDYVHGDVLMLPAQAKDPGKGWLLLTINGFGTGFGKRVDRQIKNFYPKGLRFLARTTEQDAVK